MKYFILAIGLLIFAIHLNAQGPAEKPDSAKVAAIKKEQAERTKLYVEEFKIDKSLIDSTIKKIKRTINVEAWEQYSGAYDYLIDMMFEVWLAEYRKKKPK